MEILDAFLLDATPEEMLRLEILHAHQRYIGMHPRRDSRLSIDYAKGNVHWMYTHPMVVAEELYIIDDLYRSTLYGNIIEEVMRLVAAHYKDKYNASWSETWRIVRFHVPLMLKMYCIEVFQKRVPAFDTESSG